MEQVLQVCKGELLQYVKAKPECKRGTNFDNVTEKKYNNKLATQIRDTFLITHTEY